MVKVIFDMLMWMWGWIFFWQKVLGMQKVQKLLQYRRVVTPWAKSLMARAQISVERQLRKIGDLKLMPVKPLV
jgi:hypothetical protein